MIETSTLKNLYAGQFTLSTHLIKPNSPIGPTRPYIDARAIMTDDGVDHSHYHYDDFYQAVQSLICSFLEIKEGLNPLTRKSDQLLVSP